MGSWDLKLRSLVSEPTFQPSAVLPTPPDPLVYILYLCLWDFLKGFRNPESILLPSCPNSSLCLSTPISINTFSTKFFQKPWVLFGILSYLRFENTTLLISAYSSVGRKIFNSFVGFFFFYAFLFSPYSLSLWVNLPPKLKCLPPMFWKLQLRSLFLIQISTWMCADTSNSTCLTLILCLLVFLLLRCHHHSPPHWSQNSKHDHWVLPLSIPISKFHLFFSISKHWISPSLPNFLSSCSLWFSCNYCNRLWTGFPGAHLSSTHSNSISTSTFLKFERSQVSKNTFTTLRGIQSSYEKLCSKSYVLFFRWLCVVNAIIHVLINTKAKIQAHDPENGYIQLFLN